MTDFEIIHRSSVAVSDDVNFKDRIIEVIAVPWDEEAEVVWRDKVWKESFERGAFDEAIANSVRIPVNREHNRGDTVGRIVERSNIDQGFHTAVKVARTLRGDETLQLASEGMLGASIGYYIKRISDVALDKKSMTRRIKRAFLDHLSMVESPAFVGAQAVSVHENLAPDLEAGKRLPVTPLLDEYLADDMLSWAASRISK